MSKLEPYQYSALTGKNSIRVLELSTNQVICLKAELKEHRLDSAPIYEAISYEWGSPQMSQMLIINQHTFVPITENLYSALKDIRDCGSGITSRGLWADAVCINQKDERERGEQVKLMGIIYKYAQRVIAYTGGNIVDIDVGIRLAKRLIEYGVRHANVPPGSKISPPNHLIQEFPVSAWQSLQELLSRNWYTRMWIVQESVVNDKMVMMCGTREISWTTFMELTSVSSRWNSLPQYSDFPMIAPNDERKTGALVAMTRLKELYRQCGRLPLLLSLQLCRDLKCSNSRDRVFALTLVCPEQSASADYKRSPESIYVEMAKSQLRSGGLAVLSFAGARRILNIPSWVPDWSAPASQHPILCKRRLSMSATQPSYRFGKDNVLQVRGRVVGIVNHLTSIMHYSMVTARLKRYYWARDEYDRLTQFGHWYRGGGTMFDALWRTIILNNDPDYPSIEASSLVADAFKLYVQPNKELAKQEASRWMSSRLPNRGLAPPPVDRLVQSAWAYEENMKLDPFHESGRLQSRNIVDDCTTSETSGNEYLQAMLKVGNLSRRLCTTTSGYIGMVPEEAQRHDLIVCFDSGVVPFVIRCLRPHEFSLIGDCYIHGLMGGEAYQEQSRRSAMISLR